MRPAPHRTRCFKRAHPTVRRCAVALLAVVAASAFGREVIGVGVTAGEGAATVSWRVRGGAEDDPLWRVEVRPVGSSRVAVPVVDVVEVELGRDPDTAAYSAQLPMELAADSVDVRLWVEGADGPPSEWQSVPVRRTDPAAPSTVESPPRPVRQALGEGAVGDRVSVTVRTNGLCAVSAAQIAAVLAGVDENQVRAWIAATNLSVTCLGVPVAWHPVGADDGVAFFGEAYRDVFTDRNVYRIAPGPGLRMPEVAVAAPAAPLERGSFWQVQRFEQDLEPYESLPAEVHPDCWYWDWIDTSTKTNKQAVLFPFTTPGAAASGQAHVRLWCRSFFSDGAGLDGRIRLSMGTQTNLFDADGAGPFVLECDVPQAVLRATNSLRVAAERVAAARVRYAVDSLSVGYRRQMEAQSGALLLSLDEGADRIVADGFPVGPVAVYGIALDGVVARLSGADVTVTGGVARVAFAAAEGYRRYFLTSVTVAPAAVAGIAPDPWSGTAHTVDYLVVAPAEFVPALGPLLTLRGGQLRVGVVTTRQLYDNANGGRYTPYALREFVQASRAWTAPPSMVLLAGHGHYDYRAILGSLPWLTNHIAPGMVRIPYSGSTSGELVVASDNDLADLDDDGVPEVAVGRLPARTTNELTRMVTKILAYEARVPARTNALAVADALGLFAWNSLDWTARLSSRMTVRQETAAASTTAERQRVRNALWSQLNAGVWLTAYFGHANQWDMGYQSPFYLSYGEVGALTNVGRAGVLLGTTCRMNNASAPGNTAIWGGCVGADLLRNADGGMAAVLAPTSPSFEAPGGVLADAVADAIFRHGQQRLGAAVQEALQALRDSTEVGMDPYKWPTRTLVLFGDPAMGVVPAWGPDCTLILVK